MRTSVAAALFLSLALTGCAIAPTATPTSLQGLSIQGKVHGGQQPVVGTQVYLFAANTTGYGGSGIAPSASNASISLLQNIPGSTTLDTSGGPTNGDYYVTTDTTGSFSITGDYTCTSGQQVYLYALGGNPTYPAGTSNPSIGELAIAGSCPTALTFAGQDPFVIINEVSTVAAAYAFAGFASDATHVSSSGTPLALAGIANAFANAANLVSLAGGAALATTPAGNGTVPTTRLNTLGNILASCVNSTGAVTGPTNPTNCYTLFNSTPSRTAVPVTPSETATAAINLAHNPTANAAALYGLSTANPPFAPAATSQPNDFSLWITFSVPGLVLPSALAVDNVGNAWITNPGGNNVVELSTTGAVLSGVNGFTGGGLDYPDDVAIDQAGHVWIPNEQGNSVTELSSGGSPISGSPFTGGGMNEPEKISIDGSGEVWVSNQAYVSPATYNGSLTKLSSAGAALLQTTGPNSLGTSVYYAGVAIDGSGDPWAGIVSSEYSGYFFEQFSSTGGALNDYVGSPASAENPYAVAIDGKGDIWAATGGCGLTCFVTEIAHSGTSLLPSSITNGLGVFNIMSPTKISIDGAGNAWVISGYSSNVTGISGSGSILTGNNGIALPSGGGGTGLAVDGSGNLWTTIDFVGAVEVIGAAAPVITPIAAGLPTTPTADGTSNLGTRP